MFFHNRPCQKIECPECKRMRKIYDVFYTNLYNLQFGDTFKIKAALINNDQSVLPAEIHNFESYQPLLVASTTDSIRLLDTPEGVKKKYDREQQRLRLEREAEEKRKENEEQAQKDAKRTKREERIQQFLGERPYTPQIIVSTIGGLIAGIILATIVEPIPRLFKDIFHRLFPN